VVGGPVDGCTVAPRCSGEDSVVGTGARVPRRKGAKGCRDPDKAVHMRSEVLVDGSAQAPRQARRGMRVRGNASRALTNFSSRSTLL
jgi:hypothetical protein